MQKLINFDLKTYKKISIDLVYNQAYNLSITQIKGINNEKHKRYF